MDGYATLNGGQFDMALGRAIPRLEKRVEALQLEDQMVRRDIFDRIWAKRNAIFGPWTEKGCWNRVSESFGLFGSTDAEFQLQSTEALLKDYKRQRTCIDVMNAEPYLIKLKDFNKLMEWAK
jgi:hypothetical protein